MCSNCFDGKGWPDHRERNAYRPEDEEDPRYAHSPRKRSKREKVRTKGCPENDNKAHVYEIVEVIEWGQKYKRTDEGVRYVWAPESKWKRMCVGCGHVHNVYYWWSRRTSPVGRAFNESDVYEVIDKTNVKPFWMT